MRDAVRAGSSDVIVGNDPCGGQAGIASKGEPAPVGGGDSRRALGIGSNLELGIPFGIASGKESGAKFGMALDRPSGIDPAAPYGGR
jgi:hypothetical protein